MDGIMTDYCNLNGVLIRNERSRFNIIDSLNKKLGWDIHNPIQKIYSERIMASLENKKTMATYITKGKSVYLYLTKIYNENISLIIENNSKQDLIHKIISVSLCFDQKLYRNTLFKAELLKTKNRWILIIDDILIHENVIKTNPFSNIHLLHEIFTKHFFTNTLSPFEIKIKKYVSMKNIKDLNKLGPCEYFNAIKIIGHKFPIIFHYDTKNIQFEKNTTKKLPNIKKYTQKDLEDLELKEENHK